MRHAWMGLAACAVLVSGCGSSTEPEQIDLTGVWVGSTVALNPLDVRLELQDDDGTLTGGGELTFSAFPPLEIDVLNGSHTSSTVSIFLRAPSWSPQGNEFSGRIEDGGTVLSGEWRSLRYGDTESLVLRKR